MTVLPYYMARRRAGAAIAPPTIPANYFDDVMLQLQFGEANGATTGADDSNNSFDWTGVGNAQVQSNELTLDGAGDYATLASVAKDWNFIHDGSNWTVEIVTVGRPGVGSGGAYGTLIDTTGASTVSRGIWVAVNAAGQIRVLLTRASSGAPQIDYTTTFAIPNDAAEHHIVIEWDWMIALGTGTNALRIGMDGVREEIGDRVDDAVGIYSIDNATNDLQIGRAAAITTLDLNGEVRALRVTRDRLRFALLGNATYDAPSLPLPTSEAASGFIAFLPRFFPKEETAAAGATWDSYKSESRLLHLGAGEVLAIFMNGTQHESTVTTDIVSFRSTDYGKTFLGSSFQTIATDGTFGCRNHAVGRDSSSGRLIAFYRKVNSSNVSQGVFFKTSTDDGATWSSETAVTTSLSGATTADKTVPWGKIVSTSNGLMAVFYKVDFAEVLFSTDGGETWGTRTTMYDETGTAPGYNEPYAVAVDSSNIVAMARRDGSNNNKFAFYKSTDGGSTWAFTSEEQYGATTLGLAAPGAMAVIGGQVLMVIGRRSPIYTITYTLTDIADYIADPGRAVDGTETIVNYRTMRNGFANPSDAEYGYPDIMVIDSANVVLSWYEPGTNSATFTRMWIGTLEV